MKKTIYESPINIPVNLISDIEELSKKESLTAPTKNNLYLGTWLIWKNQVSGFDDHNTNLYTRQPIPRNYFIKVFGARYSKPIQLLINADIAQRNDFYFPLSGSGQCYRYRINPDYFIDSPERDIVIVKRRISFDSEEQFQEHIFYKNQIEDFRKGLVINETKLKKIADTLKIDHPNEHVREVLKQQNYSYIEFLKIGKLYSKRNPTNLRKNSVLTTISKKIRIPLLKDSNCLSYDAKNCVPYCLIKLIEQKKFYLGYPDFQRYKEIVESGQLYESFPGMDREYVKKQIMYFFYGELFYSSKVSKLFKEMFPTVYRFIIDFKTKYGKSAFANTLTRIEATFFIDHLSRELLRQGVIHETIHDSIIFYASDLEKVQEITKQVSKERKMNFTFKIEN